MKQMAGQGRSAASRGPAHGGVALGLALAAIAQPATAALPAASGASNADEIVVTARKRQENIQDVPEAVTVFGEQQIADARLDRIDDFVALTPNMTIRSTNSRTSGMDIVLRGVGSDIQQEPGYGLYQDNVYVGGIARAFGNFNDLERVEILRGPQGALYGRNAVGGSINIISARPEDRLAARGDVLAARYDRQEYRAMVNVPLVDGKLALRVAGFLIDQDKGEYYNRTLAEELDAEHSRGGRARLRWAPTSQLELLSTVEAVREHSGPNPRLNIAGGERPRTLQYNTPNRNTLEGQQYIQEVNWTTDLATLTAVVGFRTEDATALADFDQTATQSQVLSQAVKRDNRYVELRAVSPGGRRFSWILGGSYYSEDRRSRLNTDVNLGLGFLGPGFALLATFSNADLDTRSTALFGEVGYKLVPVLEASASIRYTRDRKRLNYAQGIPKLIGLPGPLAAFGGPPFQLTTRDSRLFTNVSPSGSLTFRPNSHLNVYAKVGTGFRAGGFNTVVSNPDFLPYDEETSVDYELGLKTETADRKLRFNVAAFRLDQSNLIVDIRDPNPLFANIGQTYNANAGKARTWGLEAELMARPTRGLDLGLALGLLDPKLTRFVTSAGVNAGGNRPPGAALKTLSGIATYRLGLSRSIALFTNGKFSWRSGGYQDVENLIALDDYFLADLKAGLEGEHWRLVAYVDNVGNERYVRNRNLANTSVAFARGRTYGAQLVLTW